MLENQQFEKEITKQEAAKELGMPEDSTWMDITANLNEKRIAVAKELGMAKDSTWEEIIYVAETFPDTNFIL